MTTSDLPSGTLTRSPSTQPSQPDFSTPAGGGAVPASQAAPPTSATSGAAAPASGDGGRYGALGAPSDPLQALTSRADWQADFSGANGDAAQREAYHAKSRIIRQMAGEALEPERLEPEQQTQTQPQPETAARTGMRPEDYDFTPETNGQDIPMEDLQAVQAEVTGIAAALGAPPEWSGQISHLDRLMIEEGPPANGLDRDQMLTAIGGTAPEAVLDRASAKLKALPPDQKTAMAFHLDRMGPQALGFFLNKVALL